MIKISYMKEFVTLVENLNFTKTANQLFITQPALSRHISIIEEDIGAKLLLRDTKQVSLTPAGQAVYESFIDIVKSYKEIQEKASLLSSGNTGILRISNPYYWSEDYIDPVILNFTKNHPKIKVRPYSCQPIEGFHNMYENRYDIALTAHMDELNENIREYKFALEKLSIVMSINHPLAHRAYVRLEEFKEDTFIFLAADKAAGTEDNLNSIEYCKALMKKRNFQPQKTVFTQNVDTLGIAILQTGGVSIMPYCVKNMNRSYIRVVPLEDSDCMLTMSFYYRLDNGNPAIPQFLESVREVFPKHSEP